MLTVTKISEVGLRCSSNNEVGINGISVRCTQTAALTVDAKSKRIT